VFDELFGNCVQAGSLAFWGPRGRPIVVTRVIYESREVTGCGVVSWVGGVTSKLSGFCGCVLGACGIRYGVALCCSLV